MPGIRLIESAGHLLYELLEPEKVSACSALEFLTSPFFEFPLIIAKCAPVFLEQAFRLALYGGSTSSLCISKICGEVIPRCPPVNT